MEALHLALLLAAAPALALAVLRIALAFGVVEAAALPAAALSMEALVAAGVLATVVLGFSAAISLRRIARHTHAIALLSRTRELLATGPEAAVVDFAIHLDRRPKVDLRHPADDGEDVPEPEDSPAPAPSRTLSDLKSRLAHIPSVRRGVAPDGS